MIVRGTAKALALLGVRRPVEVPPGADDWYVNLLWMDGRKCLLIAHATTLFGVFVPNVRKPELTPFGDWLVRAIRPELHVEQIPLDGLGALDSADLVEINHDLRREPHSMGGGYQDNARPLELVAERLAGQPPRPWLVPAGVTG